MDIKLIIVILFLIYIVMSLIAQRFQTLTSSISKDLNGGNLNTDYQTMMTPSYIGFMVILNFLILTILFIILFINFKWYTALVVFAFPFIVPFLEFIVPILPKKTMINIIKTELSKNISSSPVKLIILDYIERVIEKKF